MILLLAFTFTIVICGASAAAATTTNDNYNPNNLTTSNSIQSDISNTTDPTSIKTYNSNNTTVTSTSISNNLKSNLETSKTNQSTTVETGKVQTSPDPQIYKNGVAVARGTHPAGYVYPTIAAAITDALSGDTIMLENGSTFYENLRISKNLNFDVLLNGRATLDGKSVNQIVRIASGYTVTFNDINFLNGFINGNGGAIRNYGTLILTNCAFTKNSATGYGGAIYSNGTTTLNNCSFTSNSAPSGGAIYTNGTLTITGSTFTSNIATQDGGSIYSNRNLYISDSSFTSNTASMANNGAGGAICLGDSTTNLGMNLTINKCNFTSNQGQNGGALWTNAGTSS